MIEEEIIVGEDTDTSLEYQDELLPSVILPEMNFLRFPFFALHRRGLRKHNEKMVYEFIDVREGERVKCRLSVIPSTEYGRPTAFDRRVARAVDVVIDEAYLRNGHHLENPIQFSTYHISGLMGQKSKRGGWLYKEIKRTIERIVATTIKVERSFYLKDKKQWVGGVFHLYDKYVFKGEARHDTGEVAETNCLWLSDEYIRNINARYVRPLDYKFLVRLKNDLASRLYEVLSPKFYGLKKGIDYYHIDYLNLCNMLPITPRRYFSDAQRSLKPAHDELASWGYLSKVTYVLHEGRKSIKTVRYYPGERAKREMRGEFGERTRTVFIEEQLPLPLADGENIQLAGLAQELYDRGIKPKRVAIELCENHDEDYIREKIETFDFFMEANDGTISDNPPGWLRTAIESNIEPTQKQVKAGEAAVRQMVEEKVRELEREKDKIKKPYEEECNAVFQKIMAENAEAVDDAMQEVLKENPVLEQFYDASKPFVEQSGAIQAMTKPKLRERFPAVFKSIDDEYKKKIEGIDKQIIDLQEAAKSSK